MTSATCKPNSSFPLKPLAAAVLLVFSANVQTAPVLDGVLGSNLNIDVSVPGTTVITQEVNQRDVINWREFSIGANETVRFDQPDVNAVIVNRVNGGIRSDIFGDLIANGRVFLINPSGIVFGANSEVNVNGLVASTLGLRNGATARDEIVQFRAASDAGSIVNEGVITAKDIVFLAPSITNSGTLNGSGVGASVSLIAADEVDVNTVGSGLSAQVVESGNSALIEQLGQVLAEGGRIILLASTTDNGAPSVINMTGVHQASEITIKGDLVQLTGSFNVGNSQGMLDVNASNVGQTVNGQSQALLVDGALNIAANNVSLNNADNDFTGRVDLSVEEAATVHDSNDLLISGVAGDSVVLNAENITMDGLVAGSLYANSTNVIDQLASVQVSGTSELNAVEIMLTNQANNFDGNIRVNSAAQTSIRAGGALNIAGSAGVLDLTASEISQSDALSVGGESSLRANQIVLTDSENDFAGNVALLAAGEVTLNDKNSLSVMGSVGAIFLNAVDSVQLNELNAESLDISATSVTQNGSVNVQQGTALNADTVLLADQSNNFGGNVALNGVNNAQLGDVNTLTLSGQVGTLTATAANINQIGQAGSLTVNDTANFNGANVELLQAGNTFGGDVILNVGGHAQLGTSGELIVSGRAGSATFNADSIRQGTIEAEALVVLGETRINNSNSVELVNDRNRFGSAVVLQNTGTVHLKGNETLTVQGNAGDVTLTTGGNGRLVVNGLDAESFMATATRIDQTDFLRVTGASMLNAQIVDLTASDNNQFGGLVTLDSNQSAAIKADGNLTVTGNVATGNFEAEELLFNGLAASDGLVISADRIAQSVDVDRAVIVQGETQINNSGAVVLNNAANDFNGSVVLNTQGTVELIDANFLMIEGQVGALDLRAETIAQSGVLGVSATTTLNAQNVTLNNPANDFQGQVTLAGNAQVNLRDAKTVSLAGSAHQLDVTASTVEINNALTIYESLTLTADRVNQNMSGAASLSVGGTTSIQHLNDSGGQLVRVDNANNDFVGAVILNNQVNAELRDRNTLTLQGDAASLVATATEIKQADDLAVVNQTTLNASSVELLDQSNDFQGVVNLNVTGDANLVDANNLHIAGNVNHASLNANTLTVGGLTAQGNVTFNAVSTSQTDALSVAGTTTFNGGSVSLANPGNTFDREVNLNLTGLAAITANGSLNVTGNASEVDAKANSLEISTLNADDITLQADQLALNNFTTTGNLILNGGNVIQQGALNVGGTTTLGASTVTLQDAGNNFVGHVVLESAGSVSLRDQNVIALQGSATNLNVQTGAEIRQSAALNISGTSRLIAPNIDLNDSGNSFGGAVTVNATGQATVRTIGNLSVGGIAASMNVTAQNELRLANSTIGTLSATAQQITQSDIVTVTGATTLIAQGATLLNEGNDFAGTVTLDVAGQASIADRNDVLIQGIAQILNTEVAGTLTAGELDIIGGSLKADEIRLNQLTVSDSAELRADKVTQTAASQTGGTLTIRANEIDLAQADNNFSGHIILQNVGTATIYDTNELSLSGRVNTLTVNAQRITQQQDQSAALNVQGKADLNAENVDLQNAANNFSGVVDLQVSDTVQLRDINSLIVQGDVGTLNIRVGQLTQGEALTVRGKAAIEAASIQLNNSANDFQGEVALNVAGTAAIADTNVLNVSGQLNGATELRAQSIEQSNALSTNSSVLLNADRIDLDHQDNNLNGLIRVEDASEAVLSSSGTLRVQGANLGALTLQAQVASLDELGELQQLGVTATEVRQTAALNVKGNTNLRSDKVDLNNTGNDLAGQVTVQTLGSGNSTVSIADINNLSIQAGNLALDARVQGNLDLQADNVELGDTQVDGASRIELTGSLTQSRSVTLTNASLTAGQITLTNSGNRFNGATQVNSSGTIALSTRSDLNVNTTSSTGMLALDVGGDALVSGTQVHFANSQIDGELMVSANQVSQAGRLHVEGDAVLNAIGGEIDLQNAGNRFQGTISASAEQTRLSTVGDMQLLNLNSRGGQLTADGRMILLGNVEQTGGALTFTAKGIPRPLSSAEIALLLPPSLDVFSGKEAVNPFTGLGRITLASPMIHQRSGQLVTSAGATTQFNSLQNGSVILTQNNQINGQVGVLAGQNYGQSFAYVVDQGASLFAVNNDVRLRVGGQGAEADVIAIRARGLATQGNDSVIHARMPYNDAAVGTSRSYAGLTLSIPLGGGANGQPGGLATFGESAGSGQSPGAGAIRVEVGDINRAGLGGFLTVLPFEGSNLLPGQVVYLAGPERKGTQAFFYDGARSLDRIPVVYNGTLLLSPQENAALTTAQGAVVLARQEQTRSVVRTENVAGKIINGVVAEVGPGRPATEGEGGAGKPATCEAEDSGLNCAP